MTPERMADAVAFPAREIPAWPYLAELYGLPPDAAEFPVVVGSRHALNAVTQGLLEAPTHPAEAQTMTAISAWLRKHLFAVVGQVERPALWVCGRGWDPFQSELLERGVEIPRLQEVLKIEEAEDSLPGPQDELVKWLGSHRFPHPSVWTPVHVEVLARVVEGQLLHHLQLDGRHARFGFAAWERELSALGVTRQAMRDWCLCHTPSRYRFFLSTMGDYPTLRSRSDDLNQSGYHLTEAWLGLGPGGPDRDVRAELQRGVGMLNGNEMRIVLENNACFDDMATRWLEDVGDLWGTFHIARIRADRGGCRASHVAAFEKLIGDAFDRRDLSAIEQGLEWIEDDLPDVHAATVARMASDTALVLDIWEGSRTRLGEAIVAVNPAIVPLPYSVAFELKRLGVVLGERNEHVLVPQTTAGSAEVNELPPMVRYVLTQVRWPERMLIERWQDDDLDELVWYATHPLERTIQGERVLEVGFTDSRAYIVVFPDSNTANPFADIVDHDGSETPVRKTRLDGLLRRLRVVDGDRHSDS